MTATTFSAEAARERFSSLRSGFAFFDAPGGTQVPDEVGQAIADALRDASGNLGAPYATGRAVEAILARAKDDAGRFLGCSADEISFGMNMTTLDFALSRAAARDFVAGDEILTTQLDHDGGVAPWVELAADKGLEVRVVAATDELTVDYDDLARQLGARTKVVAFALASNATGSVADAKRICGTGARGRRDLVDRRGALRGARAGRRGGDRLRRPGLLAVQVLRPASRRRLCPAGAGGVVAPVQGAAVLELSDGPEVRDRDAAVRVARRLQRDDRLPRIARRHGGAARLRALPGRAPVARACPAT